MEIVRYGLLTSGAVVKETKVYNKAGTGVVSTTDPRLVTLPGESGNWLLCCVNNELPLDAVVTDEAAYTAHKQAAIAAGIPILPQD
jgi:hypothetical protein